MRSTPASLHRKRPFWRVTPLAYALDGSGAKLDGEVADGNVFWEADNHTARGMLDGYKLGQSGLAVDKLFDEVTGRLVSIKSGVGQSVSVLFRRGDGDGISLYTRGRAYWASFFDFPSFTQFCGMKSASFETG